MNVEETKYVYSTNGENFYSDKFKTFDQARSEMFKEHDDLETGHVGEVDEITLSEMASVGSRGIIDSISEHLYEEVGGDHYDDNWIGSHKEKEIEDRCAQEIGKILKEFNCEPSFYKVTNAIEVSRHSKLCNCEDCK